MSFYVRPARDHFFVATGVFTVMHKVFRQQNYDRFEPNYNIDVTRYVILVNNSQKFLNKAGWIFLAVTSDSLAAYSLRIRWGDDAVKLKDGIPERGHLSPGFLRWFALNEFRNDDQPVAVRAEAVAGSFGLCVRSKRTRRRLEVLGQAWGLLQRLRNRSPRGWKENLGCSYAAVANASRGVGASLAAIDIPSENTGASLEVGLLGLSLLGALAAVINGA
ncbi:hypothetical protein AK812_SmicGene39108 [Symbiodinium microadriaticum]|uniref:Uncharacterized protein n=1 Tax=Symbiodinium microadriaticum TaxID=2951 RepID=A0A1Q9CC31_SYMMI|nr:hypothetical protein AK812_SmicGene39108 [Symbiodinium microadriaticum]